MRSFSELERRIKRLEDRVGFRTASAPAAAPGITDHGALSGLSDDDHPQYAMDTEIVGKVLFDAKGDLLVGTGADALTRLPVGANGKVLKANSATSTGLEWADDLTGGGGVTDHGALTGLGDPDHSQIAAGTARVAAFTGPDRVEIDSEVGGTDKGSVVAYSVAQATKEFVRVRGLTRFLNGVAWDYVKAIAPRTVGNNSYVDVANISWGVTFSKTPYVLALPHPSGNAVPSDFHSRNLTASHFTLRIFNMHPDRKAWKIGAICFPLFS